MAEKSLSKKSENTRKRRRKVLFFLTFLTAVLLITATYAWLSTTLNVKVKFIKLSVASDSGLFISLDGITFSDTVEITMDSIMDDLAKTYPNHTSQWAPALWPISSNGISNANTAHFDFYMGTLMRTRNRYPNGKVKRLLRSEIIEYGEEPVPNSHFLAFDIFLKNASGSPKSDNLYIDKNSVFTYDEFLEDHVKDQMNGLINSTRVGLVKIGTVAHRTASNIIQNIQCNNNCQAVIYEPHSHMHSETSINNAATFGIPIVDGQYVPTYAITAVGEMLDHVNGHEGTGVPLIDTNFKRQLTYNWDSIMGGDSIFELPNGITKVRVYIWIEGQDIDSIETLSDGAQIIMDLNLYKDLAGYE